MVLSARAYGASPIEVQALLVRTNAHATPSLRVVVYADPSISAASLRVQSSDAALFGGANSRDLVVAAGAGSAITSFEPWEVHDQIEAITPAVEPFRNQLHETWHAALAARLTKAEERELAGVASVWLHAELTLTGENDAVERTVVENAPVTVKGDAYVADLSWDGRLTPDGGKGFIRAMPGRVRVKGQGTLTRCDPKIFTACVPVTIGTAQKFSGAIYVESEGTPPRFAVIDTPIDSAYRTRDALALITTVTQPKQGASLPVVEALSFGLVRGSFIATYNQNQAIAYAALQRFMLQFSQAGNSVDPKAGFSMLFAEAPKIGSGEPGAPAPTLSLDPSCQIGVDPGCVGVSGRILEEHPTIFANPGGRTCPSTPPTTDLRGIGDLEVELHETDANGADRVWGRQQTDNGPLTVGSFRIGVQLNPSSFYYMRLRTAGTAFHVRHGRTLGTLLLAAPSVGDIINAIERYFPVDPATHAFLESLRALPSVDPLRCILTTLFPSVFGPQALACGGVSTDCAEAFCYRSAPVTGASIAAAGNVFPPASLTMSPSGGTAPAPAAPVSSVASLDPSLAMLEFHRQAALAERPIADAFGLREFQSLWSFFHSPVPENPYVTIYAGDFEVDMLQSGGAPHTLPFTISGIAVVAAVAELTATAILMTPDPVGYYNLIRAVLIQTNALNPSDSIATSTAHAITPFDPHGAGELIRHEFGHFVQMQLLGAPPVLDIDRGPEGVVRLLDCLRVHTFIDTNKMPPCAYSEGFANFYAIISSDEDDCSRFSTVPLARNGAYQGSNDAEDFQNTGGASTVGTGPTPLGSNGGASTEGRVTAALWDWVDLRNDPQCGAATVPGQGNDTAFPGSGDRSLAAPVTVTQVLTALRDAGLAFYLQTSDPLLDATRFLRSPVTDVTQHEALMLGRTLVVPPSPIPLIPAPVLPFTPALIPSTVHLSPPARDYLQLSSTWNFIDDVVPPGDDSEGTIPIQTPPPDPSLDVCNLRLHGIDALRIRLTNHGSPVYSPFSCRQMFEVLDGKRGRFGYDFDGGYEVDGDPSGTELSVGAPGTRVILEDDYHALVANDPQGGALYYFTGAEVAATGSGQISPRLFGFNLVTLGAAASISDPDLFTPPPQPGQQEIKRLVPFEIGERVEVGNWAGQPVLVTGGLGVEQPINRIVILYFTPGGRAINPFSFWAIDPAEYGIGHANAFDLTDANGDGLDDIVIFGTAGTLIVWGGDHPPRSTPTSALLHLAALTGIFPQGAANVVPNYGIDAAGFMGRHARFRAAGGLFDLGAGGQLAMVRNRVGATGTLGIDPRPDPTAGAALALFTSEANIHQDVPFADYSPFLPAGVIPTGVFVEGPGQLAVFGNVFNAIGGLQYLGDRPGRAPFGTPLPISYCSGCASVSAGPPIPGIPATPLPLWETHRFTDELDLTATYGLGAVGDIAGASHFVGAAEVARFDAGMGEYQFAPLPRPAILPETNDEFGRAIDAIPPVMNNTVGSVASIGVGVPSTLVVGGGAVVCLKNPLVP
jgi:hypothetical protein